MSRELNASARPAQMTRRNFIRGIGFVSATAGLAACSNGGGSSSGGSGSGTKQLTVAEDFGDVSFDPNRADTPLALMVDQAIYPTLVTIEDDGSYTEDAAETIDISDDELTYTFHIREGMKWSDGEPVTAHDFEYSWKRTADANSGATMTYMFDNMNIVNGAEITAGTADPSTLGCEATDDNTFVVHLVQPNAYLYSLLSNPVMAALRQDFAEELGDDLFTTPDHILSAGAYKLTTWDASDNKCVLEKDDSYWDADNVDVDTVTFTSVTDQQAGAMSYESGDIDYVRISGDLIDQYKDNDGFKQQLANFTFYLYFNVEKVSNVTLRQALAQAIDREELVETVLGDGSEAHLNVVASGFAFDEDGKDFNESTTKNNAYDLDAAKELYEQATAAGAPTTMTLMYDDSDTTYGLVAQYVASKLEDNLGFKFELQQVPRQTRIENMRNGDYDCVLHRWGPDFADPTTTLVTLVTGSSYNWNRWSNSEFDAYYNAATNADAGDYAKRWEDLVEAENVATTECPIIPLYQNGLSSLQRPTIKDFTYHMTGAPRNFKRVTMSD